MKRKQIWLDCDLMKYPHSGLYHYCLNLGTEMNELLLDDPSLDISCYVPHSARTDFPAAVSVREEKKGWRHWWKPWLKDCAVWHAPFQSGRIVPDKKKHPHIRVLLTIHDLNPLHEGKTEPEKKRSLAHTQSLIDKADALVCISSFTRDDVRKHCETGLKPVHVIHNGIHQVAAPRLEPGSLRPQRPFLFGMGYINRKKNYHVLLPLLKEDGIEMIIAGRPDDPEYVRGMQETAKRLGVADRLHLPGPLSEGEKAWYYKNCLAFVHPSLAEGFGAPVVEVMQFGKPLFLSDRTALPEIGGDCAFYFRSFEETHMRQVLREGLELYGQNGLAGRIRKRAEAFSWKEKAKAYLEVYKSLI